MGRDDQPKDRQRRKLERKVGKRDALDLILIACEGNKTEPNYFDGLKTSHKLSSANVKAVPSGDGPQPGKVVGFAYNYCQNVNTRWDKVCCVFDEDDHHDF